MYNFIWKYVKVKLNYRLATWRWWRSCQICFYSPCGWKVDYNRWRPAWFRWPCFWTARTWGRYRHLEDENERRFDLEIKENHEGRIWIQRSQPAHIWVWGLRWRRSRPRNSRLDWTGIELLWLSHQAHLPFFKRRVIVQWYDSKGRKLDGDILNQGKN